MKAASNTCRSWPQDVNGNRYIDFIGMFSAVNTGHCHPDIQEAVIEQLKKGIPR
jgi:4-aminobutyrate aminotransferase-like enzyme